MGARTLAELDQLAKQTSAVIRSTGGAANVTAKHVRDLSQRLENLTTVDDKVIQGGANLLLTFTGIRNEVGKGNDIFDQAVAAANNMSIAIGQDMKSSAIQLGKALNDPIKGVTALRRVGVSFTAEQIKQIKTLVEEGKVLEAQKVILRELNVEFGNAGKAFGSGPQAAIRRLGDAWEDVQITLARGVLPAVTKLAEWLQTKLASPQAQAAINSIAADLGKMATSFVAFIEDTDWTPILGGLATARDILGTIVGAFTSLPPWVQTAVVTGWGLNKLTGGAVTGIIGEIGKGLIMSKLGIQAGVVNINAGVVNGAGGGGVVGGGRGSVLSGLLRAGLGLGLGFGGAQLLGIGAETGGPLGAAAGGLGAAGMIGGGALVAGPLGAIIGSVLAVGQTWENTTSTAQAHAEEMRRTVESNLTRKSLPELRTGLAATKTGIDQVSGAMFGLGGLVHSGTLEQLRAQAEAFEAEIARRMTAPMTGGRSPDERGDLRQAGRIVQGRATGDALTAARTLATGFESSIAPSLKSMDTHLARIKELADEARAAGNKELASAFEAAAKRIAEEIAEERPKRQRQAQELQAHVVRENATSALTRAIDGLHSSLRNPIPIHLTVTTTISSRSFERSASVNSRISPNRRLL